MTNTVPHQKLRNMALSTMLLSIGLLLPIFTGQIPQVGNMLLPMHIPVLLCGLICGWQYGFFIGLVMPFVRMVIFGMPPFITVLSMTFELATYGAVAGFLYGRSKWQCIKALYKALITAMIAGRVVWCAAMIVITGVTAGTFTWEIFIASALLNAIPGIVLQLTFIPILMVALDKIGLIRFRHEKIAPNAYTVV